MTMTMTMKHTEKVVQRERSDAWPYGHGWWGHDPIKKTLLTF